MIDAGSAPGLTRALGLAVEVPDFPKPGILFKDLTPVFADHEALTEVVAALAAPGRAGGGTGTGVGIDVVVGVEARGFLLASPVALALGVGTVPVRKPGKLPRDTYERRYDLEYGSTSLHLHRDALRPGARVLVVDDVLATGGTLAAACELVRDAGAEPVAAAVVLRIAALHGEQLLRDVPLTVLADV